MNYEIPEEVMDIYKFNNEIPSILQIMEGFDQCEYRNMVSQLVGIYLGFA